LYFNDLCLPWCLRRVHDWEKAAVQPGRQHSNFNELEEDLVIVGIAEISKLDFGWKLDLKLVELRKYEIAERSDNCGQYCELIRAANVVGGELLRS
jgi:hypothetical protein